MRRRAIGPFEVAEIGLGCMNLSHAYGVAPSAEHGERLLRAALDAGVELFDTAALYGFGANEELVGRVVAPERARRRVVLCSKGGMAGVRGDDGVMRRVIDGRPEAIRRDCEASLRRLGVETIDVYYLHRRDFGVPIEESAGAVGRLVEQGKVRALGLSEMSAETLRRAHREHPVAAMQSEYSLWTREPEIAVLDACRELGAAFVAFSPLARAFLADGLSADDLAALPEKDIRRGMPRFEPAAYARNLRRLPGLRELARRLGTTPASLALAWLLAKAGHIVPIPGTTDPAHLRENVGASDVRLDADAAAELEAIFDRRWIVGARYADATLREIDTERFASDDARRGG